MSSSKAPSNSLYPEVILSNPEAASASILTPPSSSLYPSIDMTEVAEKLFPDGRRRFANYKHKVCDAVEVAGKNVMSTTSVVTTGLVSERYGEQAAKATNEGLDAAGHAIGTAWAVFKIRKAFNPASAFKPTTLAKAAAKSKYAELKDKQQK
ncbi:hypothetical protein Pint_34287 [Pistacia integerrima]|uniref:Uncharacterized protein n=1 Tax=Pistacia integerrima TaxID=434235 RepID=A0ACC0X6U7_9ROSI|nr:hypothetical protein Pint_34287 [Pistacia integerrima]